MGNAIQTAVVKVVGTLDPSVAKTVADANKKFSGLKAGAAVAGAAIAGATTAAIAFGKTALDSAAKFETGMSNISTLLDGDTETVNKRIGEMGDSIMDIAKKTGMATDDLSAGMYNIVSALGDSKDVANQVEVAAKAAKAGGATTNDAINLLSAVTKGYGDTSGKAWQKVSDLAFVTLKLGQTSFPELAANMGKVVPIASALNISQEELFGSFATLTGVTGGTAEVATQMKAVFSGLMTPSKQLTDTISSLGYESTNAMLDELGLIGTLDKLTAACGDDTQAVAKLFSSVEAQTAVLALAGAQTENWVKKTEAMSDVANATNNAFDKSTDNLQGKLDKMKQVFETFKIRVGNILIPIVTNIVDKAIPKIEAAFDTLIPVFSNLFTEAKPIIEAFGNVIPGVIQIAGGVFKALFEVLKVGVPILNGIGSVIGFLGKHMNVVIPIVGALTAAWVSYKAVALACNIAEKVRYQQCLATMAGQKLSTAATLKMIAVQKIQAVTTKGVALAQKALNLVMAANPIGIVIAAVVALGTAFVLLYKKCEPFRKFINGIGSAIKNGFMAAVNWVKGLPQTFTNLFNNVKNVVTKFIADVSVRFPAIGAVLNGVVQGIKVQFEYFKSIFDNVIGFIKNVFTGNWKGALENVANLVIAPINRIKGLFDVIVNTADNVLAAISEKFPAIAPIIQSMQAVIMPIIENIRGVFDGLISFVKNVFTGNWKAAWENVKNIFGNAFSALKGIGGAVLNVFKTLLSALGNVFASMGNAIKNAFNAVVNWFKGAFNGFINYCKTVAGYIVGLWQSMGEGIKNAFNAVVNWFKTLPQTFSNIFSGISGAVSNMIASISEKFPILGTVFQTVQTAISPYIDGIKNAISSIKGVFTSLIDFVKNVFTGNWAGAWESVKNIFGNAFQALTGLAKAPLNAVISLVNSAISGLNKLHVSIPSWVPGIGGKEFGINIPQIPMLATGGIATQPSICGEGGYPEYVISTDPKYREQNQKNVLEAANAVGALETANREGDSVRSLFKKFNGKGNSSTVNNRNESVAYRIEFSPVVNISGNTENAHSIADEVLKVFDNYAPELADKIKAVLATAREGSYGL